MSDFDGESKRIRRERLLAAAKMREEIRNAVQRAAEAEAAKFVEQNIRVSVMEGGSW